MTQLFLQQKTASGAGISFQDIGGAGDWWEVMKGPVLDGLYWDEWYNGEKTDKGGSYIYYENKLLGVPRLRQLRVEKNSCKVHSLFVKSIDVCYDSYSVFSEDKKPFGIYTGSETKEEMNNTA